MNPACPCLVAAHDAAIARNLRSVQIRIMQLIHGEHQHPKPCQKRNRVLWVRVDFT